MAQYRDYSIDVRISDTDIVITSTYGSFQKSNTVVRDGSMDANFKIKMAEHRDAFLSLAPSSTSPACYVTATGKWLVDQASSTVTTNAATVKVPTGNSGILVFQLDPTAATIEYKVNAGSYVTLTDAGTVTVTDGQTITIKASAVAAQSFINGSVKDQDTGRLLDNFSLMNSTPPPPGP